eukprot:TRINITY_DN13664_c0_g1_i1.p1 TRINITY_DN13664_c0_g1~~TRINITY_DN13664_c0_g1_i1.p1  ORF type:complete len:356 (+),score=41.19 TRINITY_DN13664_c0_g1_i1:27-1070(+)
MEDADFEEQAPVIDYLYYAKKLQQDGVTVIPVLPHKAETLRQEFINACNQFPEYLSPTVNTKFVGGGFGGFGNPASFHNMFVRKVRQEMQTHAVEFFKHVTQLRFEEFGERLPYLQQLIDRMCVRHKGTSTTRESWHKDITPPEQVECKRIGQVLGGWLNTDTECQAFSCIIGSHRDAGANSEQGFYKLDQKKQDELKNSPLKKIITVPPGHWVVFYQYITHEVLPRKAKRHGYRLYMGWRLCNDHRPLFDFAKVFESQGVIRLCSGQTPRMYPRRPPPPKFRHRRDDWLSTTFKKCAIIHPSTAKMQSLEEAGLPLYPNYSPEEIEIVTPKKYFQFLPTPTAMHCC